MSDDLPKQLSPAQTDHEAQAVSDLEAVLRLPQGRRVLLRILGRCGVYRSAYTGDDSASALRMGEQNIGLWLVAQMETVGATEYPMLLLDEARQKDMKKETVHVVDQTDE